MIFRLNIQVKNLEGRLTEQQAHSQARLDLTETNLERMRETKEALKRVAKCQKRRADQSEQTMKNLSQELAAKEQRVTELQVCIANIALLIQFWKINFDLGINWALSLFFSITLL